jgi:ATP/ADP translocase
VTPARDSRPVVVPAAALGCAALMIAYQVASKAARDTLFLSTFHFARLPAMVVLASVTSIGVALFATRVIATHGPTRVIPAGFAVSAVLMLGEWWLALRNVGVAAIVVYLHVAALAPALISGFWSILTERIDPRSAKREIGRIAGFGTLGGLLGGIAAERITAWSGVPGTLPVLALTHASCAWLLFRMSGSTSGATSPAKGGVVMSAAQAARRLVATSYLRNLALLIAGTSASAALLDFVFKAQASGMMRPGVDLMRVFSTFYTVVALSTFAIQTLATRVTLERAGLPRAIGALPGSVVVGGITAALIPGLWSVGIARGLEAVLRGSLFRAGYELLYAPIPAAEKRATKTLVDVGCDRLGEAIAAGLTMAVLAMSARGASLALLGLAVIIALAVFSVVTRLQRGYVMSLEAGLRAGSLNLATLPVEDATTRDTLERTLGGLDARALHSALSSPPVDVRATAARPEDAVAQWMQDLRSGDPVRVRRALDGAPALDPTLVPQAIQLLAWDEVARAASQALRRVAARHAGQLVDALIDPSSDFAVRRRIPALLADCAGVRAVEGLTQGLVDDRFEVRLRCARALAHVLESDPGLSIDRDRVFGAIQHEAAVSGELWDAQLVLDQLGDFTSQDIDDQLLRERAGRSLNHVFTLLSLVLPREPLRIAYRGLHASDPILRGTALEYLESVLPQAVRGVLWPHLDTERALPGAAPRPAPERDLALRKLLDSSQSIELSLEALRKRHRGKDSVDAP